MQKQFHFAAVLLCLTLFGSFLCRAEAAEKTPVSIAVIYYSKSGNTRRMAETIVDGAKRVEGTTPKHSASTR